MSDRAAFCGHLVSDASDFTEYSQHNDKVIREMRPEELVHVEEELNFYEKVPLVFLLCANTVDNGRLILQRLIVCFHAGDNHTNILQEWARNTNDWAPKLIEALAIVRSENVLRRYGFNLVALRERFKPRNPDLNLFVHPILKWLVHLCEHLVPSETRQVIDAVCGRYPDERYRLHPIPGEPYERYLELWLLQWLTERPAAIAVGDFEPGASTRNRANHCDVNAIIDALVATKDTRLQHYGECLRSAQIRFNFTLANVITFDAKAATDTNEGDGDATTIGTMATKASDDQRLADRMQTVKLTNSVDGDAISDRYLVRKSTAGYALIIDQETFYRTIESGPTREELRPREGTIADRLALIHCFASRGYRCELREDRTAAEIEEDVREVAGMGGDSLVVCILSHGYEEHVYGSDTRPVSYVRIKELMANKKLLGKPKLLVLQACRGEREQELECFEEAVLVTDGRADEKKEEVRVERVTASTGDSMKRTTIVSGANLHHIHLDFFGAYSTMPSFVAYRNTEDGSWFIQTLCKMIEEHGKQLHMFDIMTKVINKVSSKRGPTLQSMIPMLDSTLTKHFFLPNANTDQ